jgi:trans-2,3-dihydro-3-hydroxyanthranilate isomerase
LGQHHPKYKLIIFHVSGQDGVMREVAYQVFDVFTDTALEGNPLGVVLKADGLRSEQMQAIARELNLSETIFFHAPETAGHAARVRIFMPNGELPFAGHPTIGGAIAYAAAHRLGENATVVLEEGIGPVSCIVSASETKGHASFTVPRLSKRSEFGSTVGEVAAALGIGANDIGFGAHELSLWSAGVPYVMVPVKNTAILRELILDAQLWLKLDVRREGKIAAGYIYAPDDTTAVLTYRARMFAPWDGIPEDPATGSAAAAFSGAVWQAEGFETGRHSITIHQGVEMGRPSQIYLGLDGSAGGLTGATISGYAVKVAQGTLFMPD